jgi:hypothetical protein
VLGNTTSGLFIEKSGCCAKLSAVAAKLALQLLVLTPVWKLGIGKGPNEVLNGDG